ncbi:MAG: glycoside hydrolase family 2 [Ardenticatenaceae bacterium]|nr:glycoside hydrolase family 2 [Ardenticatenaceae bacterium]
MSNQRISLDGVWDFQLSSEGLALPPAAHLWQTAVVPMPWQAQFDHLRQQSGTAWYRRYFTVDPAWLETAVTQSAILHFGAVDYQATVWVNGEFVGEHEGGYLPFTFDIMGCLQAGQNELLVRVVDPTDDRLLYPDFPFSEIPHGKQSWYGPIGGIWQSVWLELRPALHIRQLWLRPQPEQAAIAMQVELSDTPPDVYQMVCTVTGPDGETAVAVTFNQTLSGIISLPAAPHLWHPDTPHLYTVTATLQPEGKPVHTVQKQCGLRTVAVENGRIILNGRPIYLRGMLDQAYYPETIYTPNSLALLEDQARQAKALGFNCLRTHIKIEDPRYYDVADRLGLLIWTEIPNWALLTEAAAARAKQTFREMVARDGHHPSIIAWTLINENWGTDLTRNAEHRRWLADFYAEAKQIDPTRLIVDNSACVGNAHVAGDLEDYHYYKAIPDHADEWDEWVADFAGRPDWAWYADFAPNRREDLPLLVSEFGNWGLPDPEKIQEKGAAPWWFETGHEWGEGIVYPHGVSHRYEGCGLNNLFPSYAEFARHSQAHMARSLHYEITTMRLHRAITGYVITEFTDVHWECNGLLTMQREPKYLLDPLLKDLNQDRVVLLRPLRWNGRPGEALAVQIQTSDVADQETTGVIQWQAGQLSDQLPAPGGTIALTLTAPGVITLTARWLSEAGTEVAVNQVDVVCVDVPRPTAPLCVVDDVGLATVLRDLGYAVRETAVSDTNNNEIVIATGHTPTLERYIQQGGRVLFLADGAEGSISLPVGRIVPRLGTAWQGDWANSFAWVKKQGPLAHLPGAPLLEMEWAAIMPDAVIADLPAWVQRTHSWAGLAVGWIHKAVSLLAVLPYGRGHILVTTFKLNATTLADEAIAQALLAGMVKILSDA